MSNRNTLTVSTALGDTSYDVISTENGLHHYQIPFGDYPDPGMALNGQDLYFPTWMTDLKKTSLNVQGLNNSSQEPVDIWIHPYDNVLNSAETLMLFAHFALCHSEPVRGANPGVRLIMYHTVKVFNRIPMVQIYTVAVGPNALGYNTMMHTAELEELEQQFRRSGELETDSMARRLCELVLRFKQKSESRRFDINLEKEGWALLQQLLMFSALKRPVSALSMSTLGALNSALNIALLHPTRKQADNALMELKTQIPTQSYNQIAEKVKFMVYSPMPLPTPASRSIALPRSN